ncbi:DUF3025 domain-containing protein [Moraxella haemolytica]|uniref:DUF3025 domain-containing protein n=1 Tax=Moraxella haemolytica TaxID=2904119 RepID=UPI002543569B|nr:DUF3025 domain-containing protein [Moraxella sp. ZY171148]WII95093.1 DUF3025 domain-containing protein [Moraxella sp. ZY171148]
MSDFSSLFATINLSAPWLMPYQHIHQLFVESEQTGELADWLNGYFCQYAIKPVLYGTERSLRFVSQDDLPHGTAYEKHIFDTANIPTRNNLHDWFGACVWSVFPKSKAVLNHVHIREMAYDDQLGGRNRVRDAITVFDENGAILVTKDKGIATALKNFDWQNSLVSPRIFWHNPNAISDQESSQVVIFGHALLEQLITPRKPLCSHTLIIEVDDEYFSKDLAGRLSYLDELLSVRLIRWLVAGATPRDLSPLPILGVPHFWDNDNASFYDDAFVFRDGRRK